MSWGKFHLSQVASLLLATANALHAGNFVVPAEGPVAFRRDQVPLDAETMAILSRQLVTLVQGLDASTAVNRRTAAQMLALASALDPGNARAREVLADFVKERHTPGAGADPLEKSRTRIWQYVAWLETQEAGAQGRALAACLTDVLAVSDPQNPRVQALGGTGERGAWKGWVPGLASYEAQAPVATPDSSPQQAAATNTIQLAEASVLTPLWKPTAGKETPKWTLAVAPVTMTAKMVSADGDKPEPFALEIGSRPGNLELTPLIAPILKLLETDHGSLPAGGRITITGRALDDSLLSKKLHSVSAAAAVLASSAISGVEPEATIIGLIDETGAFKLPGGFWDQLQSLGPGKGGRLVLPTAAAEELPSMLALERPQIFFDYEVVLAANFKELLDLSAKSPAGTFGKVSAQFKEIREKAGTQPLGQYVANPFVRRRLAEIFAEAPYHYSAKLLALQGAGNRPVFTSRSVLTAELRRAVEPIEWLINRVTGAPFTDADVQRLGTTYETCHDQVERLYRYADKNDREWVERVQDMVTTIRAMDRAAKSRATSYLVSTAFEQAYLAFLRAYADVAEELGSGPGAGPVVPAR